MRRALLATLLAAAACPATAAAQEPAPAPLIAAPAAERSPTTIVRGAALDVAVRTSAPAGSVTIRVSASPETDERGLLDGPAGSWVDQLAQPGAEPDLHEWHAAEGYLARSRPGTYWWQAYVTGPAAEASEDPVGAVESFEVLQPAASRRQLRLHPGYGRRGSGGFFLSSDGFPDNVSGARFRAVARRAGARWGLRSRRWTSAVAGRPDGFDVAGFSTRVPKHALAMQIDYVVGPRRTVVERDLALHPGLAWQDGPAYPAFDEFDLESVLLHELSHFAGNKRHAKRCRNSPLVVGMAAGEWWRGPLDRWAFGCEATVATVAQSFVAQPRGVVLHRTVLLKG